MILSVFHLFSLASSCFALFTRQTRNYIFSNPKPRVVVVVAEVGMT